jgi:hypothetical protein
MEHKGVIDHTMQHRSKTYHGHGAKVMKNWLPLVFFPELAIDRMPAPVCFNSLVISSSNLPLRRGRAERRSVGR